MISLKEGQMLDWSATDCGAEDHYNGNVKASVDNFKGDQPGVNITVGSEINQTIGPDTALKLAMYLMAFHLNAKGMKFKDLNIKVRT